MNNKEKILKILSIKTTFYSLSDISRLNRDLSHQEIRQELNTLVKEGVVTFCSIPLYDKKFYALTERLKLTLSEIVSVKNGFSFARPIRPGVVVGREEDKYIDNSLLAGAMYRDEILIGVNPFGDNFVAKIVKRGITRIVGNVEINLNGVRFVVSDDKNITTRFKIIGREVFLLQDNDKIEVEIVDYAKEEARLVRIIGVKGERKAEVISTLNAHGFSDVFPDDIRDQLEKIEKTSISAANRKDFRNLLTITIDGNDSRDFDDALSFEKTSKGYTLYVHIADVSHYVPINSPIDKEAIKRTTSVYFPEDVFPMLPLEISTGKCSLNPGEDRYALTAQMHFSLDGKLQKGHLYESIIKSDYRMTYDNVERIFNKDKAAIKEFSAIVDMLNDMNALAKLLKKERIIAGEMDFTSSDVKFEFDSERNIIGLTSNTQGQSNELIEQFMVRTNEFVADYLTKRGGPCVYRVHEDPDKTKLANAIKFAKIFKVKIDIKDFRNSFQKSMKQITDKNTNRIISNVFLRAMMKAKYETANRGHYGLASQCYCHFTSPIRRYPDLMVHRIIKAGLENNGKIEDKQLKKLKTLCVDVAKVSTEKEIQATQAEREVDDFYKCLYMKQFLGQEFNAVVSGVSKFGFFVELENSVEGLVRFENMPKDYYEVDEDNFIMVGDYNQFRLGDKIKVKLIECNIDSRKLEFACS